MHWKQRFDQEYIGAFVLNPGEDLTVTIVSLENRSVKGEGGRDQVCFVAKLQGQLPFIINKTNSKTIAKLYGSDDANWVGKSITLFASTTQRSGEEVECLRIRPVTPNVAPVKRKLSEDRFTKALVSIETGEFTVAKMLEKYELTPEQLERMPKQLEAGEPVA